VSQHGELGERSTAARQAASGDGKPGGGRPRERFYAGGFHSVRGFEFRGSSEKGCQGAVPVDPELRDILIRVQEQPTGSLMFGLGVNSSAGLTGSIILNERNFDIQRQPCRPECRGPGRTRGPLYLVAFLDGGTVEQRTRPQDHSPKVTVPMLGPVPIAIDFGFPLVKQPPPRQVFNFWMGFFS
jgi:outer membrane protein assembly factor BamA